MPNQPPMSLSLPLADVRALAGDAPAAGIDDAGVAAWAGRLIGRMGGRVQAHVEGDRVLVEWAPRVQLVDHEEAIYEAANEAAEWLAAGQYADVAVVLELLLTAMPDHTGILYNLGMTYSDLGNLDRAEQLLRQAVELDPDHSNARVALGVALARQGRDDDAQQVFEEAIREEPENSGAHRNLAAILQRSGDTVSARHHLREAACHDEEDARAWAGLGQVLEEEGELGAADEAYSNAIDAAGFGDIAEIAQSGRSRIAAAMFRERAGGAERPDAVMYCLSALERFAVMPEEEMHRVVSEIAVLGHGGLNVGNPERTYRLRSMPGSFSGLQLVCYLYVGMQQIAPEEDIGFDLAREYVAARSLFRGELRSRRGSVGRHGRSDDCGESTELSGA